MHRVPPKYRPRAFFSEPKYFGIRISAKLAKPIKINDQRLWSSVLQHLYARAVLNAYVNEKDPYETWRTATGMSWDRAYRTLTGREVMQLKDLADVHRLFSTNPKLKGHRLPNMEEVANIVGVPAKPKRGR